ncbi:MAG: hypothetical protein IJ679_01630, partial [Lachnospiraceae bacterium]|nr:hypothetical protein [Lachnospiraceae bacterium]
MIFKKSLENNNERSRGIVSLLLTHFRNRPWVVAIHALTALLYHILVPALYLGGYRMSQISAGIAGKKLALHMQESATAWFGASLVLGFCILVGLAPFTGIEGFSYLFKRPSVDFYESQPMAFSKRFLLHFGSGIGLYAVVFGAGTVCEILVVTLCGGAMPRMAAAMAARFLVMLSVYIGMYSLSVLAAILSGNVFIAVLLGCF